MRNHQGLICAKREAVYLQEGLVWKDQGILSEGRLMLCSLVFITFWFSRALGTEERKTLSPYAPWESTEQLTCEAPVTKYRTSGRQGAVSIPASWNRWGLQHKWVVIAKPISKGGGKPPKLKQSFYSWACWEHCISSGCHLIIHAKIQQ